MSIVAGDILFKLATTAGAAGNAGAGTPAGSLGKYISTTAISGTALNNLFDDVTGAENAASEPEYRCIFIHNAHATLTWQGVRIWLQSEVGGGAAVAIGVDTTAASAIGAAPAQALTIANEDTAPAGVAFTSPANFAAGVVVGDIPPGQCRAVWIRRTAANTGPVSADGVTLRAQGDSA